MLYYILLLLDSCKTNPTEAVKMRLKLLMAVITRK